MWFQAPSGVEGSFVMPVVANQRERTKTILRWTPKETKYFKLIFDSFDPSAGRRSLI